MYSTHQISLIQPLSLVSGHLFSSFMYQNVSLDILINTFIDLGYPQKWKWVSRVWPMTFSVTSGLWLVSVYWLVNWSNGRAPAKTAECVILLLIATYWFAVILSLIVFWCPFRVYRFGKLKKSFLNYWKCQLLQVNLQAVSLEMNVLTAMLDAGFSRFVHMVIIKCW